MSGGNGGLDLPPQSSGPLEEVTSPAFSWALGLAKLPPASGGE